MGMVESFIPGRIRLRSALLRDADTAAMLQGALSSIPAVTSADLNGATGSLLLKYDTSRLSLDKLMPLLPLLDRVQQLETAPAGSERTASLRALLVEALKQVL